MQLLTRMAVCRFALSSQKNLYIFAKNKNNICNKLLKLSQDLTLIY